VAADDPEVPTPTAAAFVAAAGGLERLEERLGHRFADRGLLVRALSHRSSVAETGGGASYERLEFLGDAVLAAVTADWLYATMEAAEGELTRLKSHLVSEPVLAGWARGLGLGGYLRLGVGEERSGGREKESLLADALEAILGALFLEGGMEAARRLVVPLLGESAQDLDALGAGGDAKTALQEVLQARGRGLPDYRLVAETGPGHAKTFGVECWVGEEMLGYGEGTAKKRAEQAAAAEALERLRG
jgi:ribonuclease-3